MVGVAGGLPIVTMLVHVFTGMASQLAHALHVPLPLLGEIVAGIVAASVLAGFVQVFRGQTKFSLDPADTPAPVRRDGDG